METNAKAGNKSGGSLKWFAIIGGAVVVISLIVWWLWPDSIKAEENTNNSETKPQEGANKRESAAVETVTEKTTITPVEQLSKQAEIIKESKNEDLNFGQLIEKLTNPELNKESRTPVTA